MPTPIDRVELQLVLSEEQAQLVEVLPHADTRTSTFRERSTIPLKELNAETARRLEHGRPVVVYCHDYQ